MEVAYLVWHTHDLGDHESSKLIGVYSSEEEAAAAVARAKLRPGLRERPQGFCVSKYIVNKDEWVEGYVTDRHHLPDK